MVCHPPTQNSSTVNILPSCVLVKDNKRDEPVFLLSRRYILSQQGRLQAATQILVLADLLLKQESLVDVPL